MSLSSRLWHYEPAVGARVRTPDGRTGEVVDVSQGRATVRCFQASNVNRTERWKVEFLEVIG